MSRQYNKVQKRRRHKAYLARKKVTGHSPATGIRKKKA